MECKVRTWDVVSVNLVHEMRKDRTAATSSMLGDEQKEREFQIRRPKVHLPNYS